MLQSDDAEEHETLASASVDVQFKEFLQEFETIIVEASQNGQRIYLTEAEAHLTNPRIHDDLVQDPEATIAKLELMIDRRWEFAGRLCLVEMVNKVQIHDLRHDHLFQYISIPVMVQKVYEVKPAVVIANWMCARCGCHHQRPNRLENQLVVDEPRECPHCNRKGNQTRFMFDPKGSKYIDVQFFECQQPPEGMRGRHSPAKLECVVRPHLVNEAKAGDRLILNGILKPVLKGSGKNSSLVMGQRFHVYAIEKSKAEMDEDLTQEDIEMIKRMALDDRILWKMSRSLAPHIYGQSFIKMALLLQMFGGVPMESPDVPLRRGDIHMLLLGDPATAKSQLCRTVAGIHPRAIIADGGSSSGAGLTAAALRNKDDIYYIQAGAMVMADGGMMFIDELDKIDKTESAKLGEGMESQVISFNKAGSNSSLNTRCSVLAAANPKFGQFDPFCPLLPQIGIVNLNILSRFDVIFFTKDHCEEGEEEEVADRILEEYTVEGGKVVYDREIEVSQIRKYIAWAKENVNPVLTEEAKQVLFNCYIPKRQNFLKAGLNEDTGFSVDRRKVRSLARLAQAAARGRLSNEVSVEDAHLACQVVFEWSIAAIKPHTGAGQLDLGLVSGVREPSMLERKTLDQHFEFSEMKEALKVCEKIAEVSPKNRIPRSALIGRLLKDGRFSGNFDSLIKKMLQAGYIFMVEKDVYKVPLY